MFDEGNRTITVTLLDGETKIKIDNVPSDSTVSSFLSRLLTLDYFQDIDGEVGIMCGDEILTRSSCIDDDEIKLITQPKKRKVLTSFFLFILFIALHLTPIVMIILNYRLWYVLTIYVISLFVLGICCLIFKPSANTFNDLWNYGPTNIVFIDILVLFFKSLLPSFRLENVLLNH